MSALILIELNGSEVSANSRAAITAASQLSDTIDALVLTNDALLQMLRLFQLLQVLALLR